MKNERTLIKIINNQIITTFYKIFRQMTYIIIRSRQRSCNERSALLIRVHAVLSMSLRIKGQGVADPRKRQRTFRSFLGVLCARDIQVCIVRKTTLESFHRYFYLCVTSLTVSL